VKNNAVITLSTLTHPSKVWQRCGTLNEVGHCHLCDCRKIVKKR